jgi:dihydroflavonol-4-reductase
MAWQPYVWVSDKVKQPLLNGSDSMKVLVTGSTGFIGSRICRALLERGDHVVAFHRESSSLKLLEGLDVSHAVGDMNQPDSLERAVQGIDVVFHAAASLGDEPDPGRMYAVNVEGTRNLLNLAENAGVQRLVYTSSVAALGIPDQMPGNQMHPGLMDENHAWNYRPEHWPYGYTKHLAEQEIQFSVARGLDVVIVNPSVVIGKADRYSQTQSLITRIAKKQLRVFTSGGMNIVHIDQVVAGHLAALERGQCGARYILGGENISHQELFSLIARIAKVPAPSVEIPASLLRMAVGPMKVVKSLLPFPWELNVLRFAGMHFYYDNQRSQNELGLSKGPSAETTVKEAYEWYMSL